MAQNDDYVGYIVSYEEEESKEKRVITMYSPITVEEFTKAEEAFEVRGQRFKRFNWLNGGCFYKDFQAFQQAVDWFHKGTAEDLEARLKKFCSKNRLTFRQLEVIPRDPVAVS